MKSSMTTGFMSMMTNTAFKWNDYFSKPIQMSETAFILGMDCGDNESLEIASNALIWISYRSNILFEGQYISDQGWGCLLRVAQMILANVLIRNKGAQQIQELRQFIISQFQDNVDDIGISPYSIQQIIKRAREEDYKIKIGDWYTGPKIMTIMEELHAATHRSMVIVNFYEQCIIEEQFDTTIKTPHLLVVHAKLNTNQITKEIADQLKICISIPQFAGGITGKSKKAYFLLGYQGDNALYFDPHFVQDSQGPLKFNDKLKVMPFTSLSSTLGLTYYIENQAEYQEFKKVENAIFTVI